jgi:hypothetical protein
MHHVHNRRISQARRGSSSSYLFSRRTKVLTLPEDFYGMHGGSFILLLLLIINHSIGYMMRYSSLAQIFFFVLSHV